MTVRNITIRFAAFLMIGVLGILIANEAIFLHAHKLNDGTVINHAHPYNKSNDSKPYKSHHHSNAEILFFQHLKVIFLIVFLAIALLTFFNKEKFSFFISTRHTLFCIILPKGRAPPIS